MSPRVTISAVAVCSAFVFLACSQEKRADNPGEPTPFTAVGVAAFGDRVTPTLLFFRVPDGSRRLDYYDGHKFIDLTAHGLRILRGFR